MASDVNFRLGNEGNPLNLMFLGVILIALLGSALGSFRARAMGWAMAAAAAAQLLSSTISMFADLLGGIYSMMFTAIWLGSAAMFRRAERS